MVVAECMSVWLGMHGVPTLFPTAKDKRRQEPERNRTPNILAPWAKFLRLGLRYAVASQPAWITGENKLTTKPPNPSNGPARFNLVPPRMYVWSPQSL